MCWVSEHSISATVPGSWGKWQESLHQKSPLNWWQNIRAKLLCRNGTVRRQKLSAMGIFCVTQFLSRHDIGYTIKEMIIEPSSLLNSPQQPRIFCSCYHDKRKDLRYDVCYLKSKITWRALNRWPKMHQTSVPMTMSLQPKSLLSLIQTFFFHFFSAWKIKVSGGIRASLNQKWLVLGWSP